MDVDWIPAFAHGFLIYFNLDKAQGKIDVDMGIDFFHKYQPRHTRLVLIFKVLII